MLSGTQKKSVGSLIKEHREAAKMSLKQLAKGAGLTSAYLSYLERGKRGFTDETLLSISIALQLRRKDQNALLGAGGLLDGVSLLKDDPEQSAEWHYKLKQLFGRAEALVNTARHRDFLLSAIEKVVERHTKPTDAIEKVLIPIATWHVHLLSNDAISRMVGGIVAEGKAAGISSFGIVMPPNLSSTFVNAIARAHDGATILPIAHDPSRLGLGPAIQAGQDFIGNEAFAVALPDIQFNPDDPVAVLALLKSVYAKRRQSVLATRKATGLRFIRKGAVIAAENADSDDADVRNVTQIHYGQAGHGDYYVLGRYILTSSIFEVIRSTPPEDDGFVRLGAVLEQLLEREPICAVDLSDTSCYSLSQELMDEIINKLTEPFDETQMLAALDALGVQVIPWGRDAQALTQLLSLLEPLREATDSMILSSIPTQLGEMTRFLSQFGSASPYIFWRMCFKGINQAISVCSAPPAPHKTLAAKVADHSRKRIALIVQFAEEGSKSLVSEQMWEWWNALEQLVRPFQRGRSSR
jgi:transcriptional regulator with XRE-family HTH domain/dTDP-glucose pyrophosphorylase